MASAGLLCYSYRAGAPWLPTAKGTRKRMLALLELKPGETIIELGAGDGRILIDAVKQYGVRAIGYEINPVLSLVAKIRVRLAGLEDQVEIRSADFFSAKLPDANAITLFLLQDTNQRVKREILPKLAPGTRVVSYAFTFEGITPTKVDRPPRTTPIYLYQL